WTVLYDEDRIFEPSCLNRTVRVKRIADAGEVPSLVEPISRYLQTVGTSVPPPRLLPLAEALGTVGVTRVCSLGAMVEPSLEWRHDGRVELLELVHWVDLEPYASCELG